MSEPEEFILAHGTITMDHVDDVVHYVEGYNPAKAREYYLRTRQLKGRQAGSKDTPVGRPAAKTPVVAPKKTALKPAPTSKQVEARVAEMKGRLEKLRKVLRELVKQAKARSGIDPKDDKSKAPAGSKKLSAAERKKAAEASAKYRKANPQKDESISDEAKRLAEQIKDVNAKIAKARADLKSAVAKARTTPAAKSRRNN